MNLISLNIEGLGLALVSCLVLVSLLWIVIGSYGHWLLKAALICASVLSVVFIWGCFSNLAGWPSSKDLPEKFDLYYITIVEPSSKEGTEGSINFLIKDKNKSVFVKDEIRLYKIPYSKEAHRAAAELLEQIMQGKGRPMDVQKIGKGKGNSEGHGNGTGEGEGEGGARNHSQFSDFVLYRLPPPKYRGKIE